MGASKKQLANLFNQEMDRKEFLGYLGLVALTVTGVAGIMKNLSNLQPSSKKTTKGYGSGPYGK